MYRFKTIYITAMISKPGKCVCVCVSKPGKCVCVCVCVCVCLSVLVLKPNDLIRTTFTHCFSNNLKPPQVSI